MQLEYAKQPQWCDAEHTGINVLIRWDGWDAELPFTATKDDPEAHGQQIYQNILAGVYGEIAEFVPPPAPTKEELASAIRQERDLKLAQTDWTQAGDVPQAIKTKWSAYRQALRDVPLQPEFPFAVVWPTKSE